MITPAFRRFAACFAASTFIALTGAKPAFPAAAETAASESAAGRNLPARTTPPPGLEEIVHLARGGMLDSALVLCRKALAADPGDASILLMLGKLTPEGGASAEFFKKAVSAGGASPAAEESLFRLGQFHYAAGKYHLAIPFFRDYLRSFPSGDWSEPAHYWMGNACLSLAQSRQDRAAYLDSGIVYFQRLLDSRKPEEYYHALAREGLAKGMASKGDRPGALQTARAALADAPEDTRAPLMLLLAQLSQGMDRGEEKNLMAALIKAYPRSPEARYLRRLNLETDPSRWRSGYAFPRPNVAKAGNDSLVRDGKPTDPKKPAMGIPTPSAGEVAGRLDYTLQLAAFSQPANAKAMVSNLIKLGFEPELAETRRGGKPIYQVRLGRFASAEEASDFALKNLKPHKLLSQPIVLSP